MIRAARSILVVGTIATVCLSHDRTALAQTGAAWTTTAGAGDGLWTSAGNWVGGVVPTAGPLTSLTFGSTTTVTGTTLLNQNLATPFELNSMTFIRGTGGIYTISGGDLLFTGANANITFTAATTAAGALTNTIANNIVIGGGGLSFVATSTNNNVLRFIGTTITTTQVGNATLTLDGSSTGANTILNSIQDTPGTSTIGLIKNGAGTWILGGNNAFTGDVSIFQGVLRVTSSTALGSGANLFLGSGTNLGTLSFTGGAAVTFTLNRAITLAGSTGGGLLSNDGLTTSTVTVDGTITAITGSKVLQLGGTQTTGVNLLNSQISDGTGTVGLQKVGVGTWAVTNTGNAFTGGVTVLVGALRSAGGGNPLGGLNFANNNVVLSVTAGTVAVLETAGTITASLGTGVGQIQWRNVTTSGGGGFAAAGGQLDLNFGNTTDTLTWAGTAGFISGTNNELQFGSTSADSLVNFNNHLALNTTTARTIRVFDNAGVATDAAAITGVISGANSGLIVLGTTSGRLILSGANTYGGGTSINAGSVVIANDSALSTGTVTLTAATIITDTSRTLSNTFILSGAVTFSSAAGVTLAFDSPGSITVSGGAAVLSNSNVDGSGSLVLGDDILLLNNLTLSGPAGITLLGNINVSGTRNFAVSNVGGTTLTVNAIQLSVAGSTTGNLILTGTTPLTISTIISDGPVAGGGISISGGTVNLGASNLYTGGTTLISGSLLFTNSGSIGTGNLTFSGGGLAAFGGAQSVTNNVILVGNGAATGTQALTLAGTITVSGGTRTFSLTNTALTTLNNVILGETGTARTLVLSGTTAVPGIINGVITENAPGGGLQVSGANWTLTNANLYTGGTTLVGGILFSGAAGAVGSGNLTFSGGSIGATNGVQTVTNNIIMIGNGGIAGSTAINLNGTITVSGGNRQLSLTNTQLTTIDGNIVLGETGTARLLNLSGTTSRVGLINGVISEPVPGGILQVSGGSWTLSNSNLYTGGTTLTGGILFVGNAGAIGTGTIVFNGGAIAATNGVQTLTHTIIMTGNGAVAGSTAINIDGTITVSGGNRQLSLSNTLLSTFNGNIILGEAGAARTLTLAGAATSVGLVNGTIGESAAGGSLIVSGGNWTLTNASSYTGTTTLAGGLLLVGNAGSIGTGLISFSGGAIGATNAAQSLTNNVILFGNGAIGGSTAITLDGTITVSGGNRQLSLTNTQLTTFNGNIILGETGAARTLTLAGAASSVGLVNGTISESAAGGSLIVSGGNWTLNNASSYTGTTTLAGGLLLVGNGNSIGTGLLTFSGGTIGATNAAQTLTNNILLVGTGIVGGSTAITLSGSITVSGNRLLSLTNSALSVFNGNVFLGLGTASSMTLGGTATTTGVLNGVISELNVGSGISVSGGNWIFNQTNTFSGTATLSGGVAVLGASGVFGSAPVINVGGVSLGVTNGPQTVTNAINLSPGNLTTTGASQLTLTGGLTTFTSRSIIANNTAGTVLNTVSLNTTTSAVALTIGGTGNVTIAGPISQVASTLGGVAVTGTLGAVTTFLANNTYSGFTTVGANAILQFGDGSSSNGSITGTMFVTAGTGAARFNYNTITPFSGITISGGGNVVVNSPAGGGLIYNSAMSYTGSTQIVGGTLRMGIAQAVTSSHIMHVGSTGTLDLNGTNLTLTALNDISGTGGYVTSGSGSSVLTLTGGAFSGTLENGSGTLALTKTGAGTLRLGGGSTFSGTSTLNSGVLILGNDDALGTAVFNVVGGTLSSDTTARTIGNDFNLLGNLVIGGTSNLILNGTLTNSVTGRTITVTTAAGGAAFLNNIVLSDISTSLSLTISGSGAVVLGDISNGTAGSTSNGLVVTSSGAGVTFVGNSTYAGFTTIGAATAKVIVGANSTSTSSPFGNSTLVFGTAGGALQADSSPRSFSNLILLAADATFTGTQALAATGTILNGAAVARNIIANNSGGTTLGPMVMNSVSVTPGGFVFAGNSSLTVGIISLGTGTSGTASITNSSAGGVTFVGDNTYSGITTVAGVATLNIGVGGTIGNVAGLIALTSGTGGKIFFNRSDIMVFGGAASATAVISGSGTVTVSGDPAGGVRFNAAQTYFGITSLQQGTLRYGIANAVSPNAALMINTGGTLDLNGFAGAIATLSDGSGGGGHIINGGALAAISITQGNFSGTITGPVSVNKITGTAVGTVLTLGGMNDFTGTSTLTGGILQVASDTALSSVTWYLQGGTLQGTGGLRTFNNNFVLNGANVTITSDGDLLFNGPISMSITGTISMSNTNHTTTFGDVQAGGSVTTTGRPLVLLYANSATNVISGAISQGTSTSAIITFTTQTGAQSLVRMDGIASYTSGFVTVGGGITLSLNSPDRLPGNTRLNLVDNAVLALGGNQSLTVLSSTNVIGASSIITNSSGSAAVLSVSSGNYAGLIQDGSGGISLAKLSNTATLTLLNNNTYSGVTTVGSGFLALGSGGTTGMVAGPVVITGTGSLIFNRNDVVNMTQNITNTSLGATGTGTVTFTGGGTYSLNGVNRWVGATTVGGGTTVTLGAGTVLGSTSAITITNGLSPGSGGTLIVDSGAVIGTGAITLGVGSTFMMNGTQTTGLATGTGSVSLTTAAVLKGSGVLTAQVTASNGSDIFIGDAGTVATLTLRSLILSGGSLNFDFDTATDLLRVTATASIVAPSVINLNLLGGFAGAGTYDLITGPTGLIAGTNFLSLSGANSFAKSLQYSGNNLQIVFSSVSTRTWDGFFSNIWDVNTTPNFSGSVFNQFESVTFTDGAVQTDITLSNNGAAITPNSVLVNNSATTYTFRGDPIGGSGGIDKQGTGLLVLVTDNTFTGPIAVSGGGTLQIGDGGIIGSVTAPAIALDNDSTLVINRLGAVTLSSNVTGSGNLVVRGGGVVSLRGANGYTGMTTILDGTLQTSGTAILSAAGSYNVINGTLAISGTVAQFIQNVVTVSTGGAITVNSASLTTSTLILNGGTANATGTLTATFAQILGGGTVNVNLTNGFGVTTVSLQNGTININVDSTQSTLTNLGGGGVAGAQAIVNIAASKTLTIAANFGYDATGNPLGAVINGPGILSLSVTTGVARTITVNDSTAADNDLTINAQLSGSSQFTKAGNGTLYLTAANLMTGTNTLAAGTLKISTSAALGTNVLNITGNATGSTASILSADGTPQTITNNIIMLGNFSIGGTQDLTLSGLLTQSASARSLGINMTNGATAFINAVVLSETATVTRTLTFIGGGRGIVGSISDTVGATAFGSISVSGVGLSLTLANANSYGGSTQIQDGSLFIGHEGALGVTTAAVSMAVAGNAVINPALLTTTGITFTRNINVVNNTNVNSQITLGGATSDSTGFTGNITFSAANLYLSAVAGGTVNFSGVMAQGSLTAGGITKTGAGLVILSGANTFTSGVTVADGKLLLGNLGTLASQTRLTVGLLGTLDLNGSNITVTTLTDGAGGGGLLTSATVATLSVAGGLFSGTIDGALVSLDKVSTGTLILSGNNTYAAGTTVAAGTLRLGNGGASGSVAGNITNSAILAVNRSDVFTLTNLISGPGAVLQSGTGTLIFNSDQLYTGITTIAAGALQLGDGGSTGSVASTTIVNNSLLVLNRSDNFIFGTPVTGTGGLELLGSGTVTFTGDQAYTGITTIGPTATLRLGNNTTAGAVTGSVVNDGSLVFNRSDAHTYNGAVSGTGQVTIASGTVTFGGTSSYNGATSVAAGTLVVTGTLGATTVTVATGATLQGSGTLGGAVNVLGGGSLAGTLTVGGAVSSSGNITVATTGTIGTMHLTSLTLNGGALNFDLDAPGSGDRIIVGGITPIVTDTTFVNFTNLGGVAPGTYQLITGYTGLLNSTDFDRLTVSNTPFGFRIVLANDLDSLDALVTILSATNLLWTGAAGNQWDYSSLNFLTTTTVSFTDGTDVTFDNSADTTGTISVTTSGVAPQHMTVSNDGSHPYLFSDGAIVATGTLTKVGSSRVDLQACKLEYSIVSPK